MNESNEGFKRSEKEEIVVEVKFLDNPRIPDWVELADGFQNEMEARAALYVYQEIATHKKHAFRIIHRKSTIWSKIIGRVNPINPENLFGLK